MWSGVRFLFHVYQVVSVQQVSRRLNSSWKRDNLSYILYVSQVPQHNKGWPKFQSYLLYLTVVYIIIYTNWNDICINGVINLRAISLLSFLPSSLSTWNGGFELYFRHSQIILFHIFISKLFSHKSYFSFIYSSFSILTMLNFIILCFQFCFSTNFFLEWEKKILQTEFSLWHQASTPSTNLKGEPISFYIDLNEWLYFF